MPGPRGVVLELALAEPAGLEMSALDHPVSVEVSDATGVTLEVVEFGVVTGEVEAI